MKRLLKILTVLSLSGTVLAQIDSSVVDQYYDAMKTQDATGLSLALKALPPVPEERQSELYTELIDRSTKSGDAVVTVQVITLLFNKGPKFVWNDHLNQSILSLVTHKESEYEVW